LRAIIIISIFSVLPLWMLSIQASFNIAEQLIVCVLLFIIALGYTIPPLKLVYRGIGELTVGITHSFAVIVMGYIFQGGGWQDDYPWILSLPVFFSIFPSIILAGIPDYEADKIVAKKTIVVMLGYRLALRLASVMTWLAIGSVLILGTLYEYSFFVNLFWIAIPNALFITYILYRLDKKEVQPRRIDGAIIVTLLYILWFVIIPLLNIS
jgi:1,4-dihydroxy-2-naphthoate polyprenyltransferase